MANKKLFNTYSKPAVTTTRNQAGGKAYKRADRAQLAQYALTGCFNDTFYVSGATQLNKVLDLCKTVDAEFIGKLAVYARRDGYMKDMPAVLCAVLASKDVQVLKKVFPAVITNGKMLRNFVQIIRSGVTGRKSFGTAVKRLIQKWFDNRSPIKIFNSSVGQSPSMADVIKMVHPRGSISKGHNALYGYLLGKDYDFESLPYEVQKFERYKRDKDGEVPNIPFRFLTALGLKTKEWKEIAKNAPWQMTRMNLNTFARHNVYDKELTQLIADRLRDPELVAKSRVFPYQLLAAYKHIDANVPRKVIDALHDALELSVDNIPELDGNLFIFPDSSGSMGWAVTGQRMSGATSKVKCTDVAGLVAAAYLRKNPDAVVRPFDTNLYDLKLEPRDTVMSNARKLALNGGGTNCSLGLKWLNQNKSKVDYVLYISDNQSWADPLTGRGTQMQREWETLKRRNRNAKMVCIDITPSTSTQATGKDVLNIGGFNDNVFKVTNAFFEGKWSPDFFENAIDSVDLDELWDGTFKKG